MDPATFSNGLLLSFWQMSSEVKCLHPMSSGCETSMASFSNMIYHKFSYDAASYMLIGVNC